jgi:hypothetical protein
VLNLHAEVRALDQLVIKPHRVAMVRQHGGQMLGRVPALALVRNENIRSGHAARSSSQWTADSHSAVGVRVEMKNAMYSPRPGVPGTQRLQVIWAVRHERVYAR